MPEVYKGANQTTFYVERVHAHQAGIVQLPVAGPAYTSGAPTPCVYSRLHSPVEGETVYWLAVAEGGAPMVPSHNIVNPNRIFLRGRRSAIIPVPLGGAGHAHAIAGEYHYGITTPEGLGSSFYTGEIPGGKKGPHFHVIPSSNFVQQIVSYLSQQTGAVPDWRAVLGR